MHRNVFDFRTEFLAVVNEAFVTQLSIASRAQPSNTEDILATIQLFSGQYLSRPTQLGFFTSLTNNNIFNRTLISGVYRVLGIPLEHVLSEQPDQSGTSPAMNPYLPRCLCVQAALEFQGNRSLRPIGGLIAMTMLSLRYFLSAIKAVLAKRQGTDSELKKPG